MPHPRVKIIATLGPASSSLETITAMAREGVAAFRINFSHGNVDEWLGLVKNVREAEKKTRRHIALIGDLQGPSVRLGVIEEPFTVKRGDIVEIVLADRAGKGERKLPLPIEKFFETVEEGDRLLMDDGRLVLAVEEVYADRVIARVLTEGKISSHKAIVIRGKEVELPAITNKDFKDIEFAVKNDFDYIALSYVRSGDDIRALKSIIEEYGRTDIGVIAKVETVSGVRNLKNIIEESDVVLVARGDLGMQFPLEDIPWLQRTIINESLKRGKPVIVATQILGSMAESPTPSRAEIVDVVTAMIEGADAIMLTGETAVGKYPLETIKWLKKIIEKYSDKINYPRPKPLDEKNVKERFAYSVVVLSEELEAKLAVFSKHGNTALRIAKYRPNIPFYVTSNDDKVLRKLSIIWGVKPLKVEAEDYMSGLKETYRILIERNEICYGDIIVLTYGMIDEEEHLIKIVRALKPSLP